jgi:hypothetical protein
MMTNNSITAKEQIFICSVAKLIHKNQVILIQKLHQLKEVYEIIEQKNSNMGLNLAYEVVPDHSRIYGVALPGKDGR